MADYPDLDCVWLNSGTQHPIRLSQPEAVDLGVFHTEIATNFSRLVDLSIKFLPHLLRKPHPTALVVTGTLLALIPAVTVPAYSASKAALNAFMMCLRRQHQGASTRIIEVWPPATQSTSSFLLPMLLSVYGRTDSLMYSLPAELHDYMGEKVGRNLGMPVQDFVDQAYDQLVAGADQVIVGTIGPEDQFLQLAKQRRQTFDGLSDMMLKHFQL